MRWILMTAIAAALLGCGEPLSNRLLEEDVLFRTSLPMAEDVATSAPEDEVEGAEARDLGDRATLVTTTKSVSALYNGIVWSLLGVVDAVVQTEPSRREDDVRIWGPFAGRKTGSSLILAVRRADAGIFTYSIEGAAVPRWAADEDTDWAPVMSGTFLRGASLRDGEGQFVLDAAAWALIDSRFEGGSGQMAIAHARRGDGVAIDVVVADWTTDRHGALDAACSFRRRAEGGGFFEYETVAEVLDNGGEPENYVIRVRWNADGAGRGDYLLRGEGLGAGTPGSECWDAEFGRTYFLFDPPGEQFDQVEGEEASCLLGHEAPGDPAPELPEE